VSRITRRAFTRIDLAATMVIVGLSVLLVIPTMTRARSSASRTRCQEQLSQIARAIQRFASSNRGELVRNLQGPQLTGIGDPAHLGGLTLLLPYLEQGQLYNQYNFSAHFADPSNQAVTETEIPLFLCPDNKSGRRYPERCSLVNPSWRGAVSDYASIRQFFHPIGPAHDPNGLGALEQNIYGTQTRIFTSMITDGESYTIAHVERAGLPEVWAAGRKLDDGASANTMVATEPRGPWAGYSCVTLNMYSDDGLRSLPGGRRAINGRNAVGDFAQGGVYSFHAGGAFASFMDGSVRFLREGMDPYILFALGSRSGGEIVSPEEF